MSDGCDALASQSLPSPIGSEIVYRISTKVLNTVQKGSRSAGVNHGISLHDYYHHLLFLDSLLIRAPALLLFSVVNGCSPLAEDLARRLGTEWVLMAGKRTWPSR